jgi:hypothetical protein
MAGLYFAQPDYVLFSGPNQKACKRWLKENPNGLWFAYKRAEIGIRLAVTGAAAKPV